MISCTHHYLAVASNSFCVKIYVKMSSDWMEAWRIDSEVCFSKSKTNFKINRVVSFFFIKEPFKTLQVIEFIKT